ncbi:hypothetical protein CN692_09270 [Bacillus sp. AFS002410]|uniref:glycoside hydrolase family 88 protein n=1 Tax=Bacillus sp. AFS002410 TaxID=2033481 RepID=UPI000BF14BB6|nr:glycoside hydrolase family 88 protein [Bacillus sp. AFS002410]PEJ58712.1 hypothetical protein CN692_09270 [Bacillus sp. AFS002410]
MVLKIICLIFFIIITMVIFIDILPLFRDWLSRIHIGRFDDKKVWKKVITQKAINWLLNMPKIKVTDNTRFVVIDILKGNYTRRAIQHWQEAALLLGLSEYTKLNSVNEVENQVKAFLNKTFDSNGQWKRNPKNIDVAILSYAIMKLDFIESDKYKKALDYTWDLIQDHIGPEGIVGYRKSMNSYRYVDTIGFICPFLISYGMKFNKPECIDLAVKQIKEYEEHGMLGAFNIPSHAYKIENKMPLGLYGWGRGLGWYSIGLIDSWNELPQEHKYKTTLEDSVKRFANSAIEFQQENGCWNWTVTRPESRADSSTTATLSWFMLNASKIEDISDECISSTDKAICYLMGVTRRDGAIDFSQGDTKDIGVYSMLFNILPFTQGFSIRTISLYTRGQYVKENSKIVNL